jgi:hypothetical protein
MTLAKVSSGSLRRQFTLTSFGPAGMPSRRKTTKKSKYTADVEPDNVTQARQPRELRAVW